MFRTSVRDFVGGVTHKFSWIVLLGLSFSGSVAHAGFGGVSLGASYPTALGNSYSTLNSRVGVQAEAWLNAGFLPPILQFHFSTFYESFYLRNQTSVNMPTVGLLGGIQLQSPEHGSVVSSFIALDVGAVYNSLSFSSVASAVTNNALNFAAQVVPGIDVPIYKSFGIQAEAPIRIVFFRQPWVVLDAVVSLRLKL
jgi:hypothetical protein